MKSIVQFGAGNIGRSLVGQLFSRAGYEVIFVDAIAKVVDALNERREYEVVIKDTIPPGSPDRIAVRNVRAISADDSEAIAEAIARAELIATAVGPAVLPKLAPTIAKGLAARSEPVSIIMCENLRNAAGMMRQKLAEHLPGDFDIDTRVGLVETSIGKMVPIMPAEVTRRDPLVIWAEAYNQIIADRAGFIAPAPEVEGLVLKDNFAAYVDRKLFIHNLGHSAAAFGGFLGGKERIWECMEDEEIRTRTRAAMWASGEALIEKYPAEFDHTNQTEHVDDLLRRFANRALNDSVFRVGRDLHRKLSPEDRCVGALRMVQACTGSAAAGHIEPILSTIAAGLCFKAVDEHGAMFPADEEFHKTLQQRGAKHILESVCGLKEPRDADSIEAILRYYRRFREQ